MLLGTAGTVFRDSRWMPLWANEEPPGSRRGARRTRLAAAGIPSLGRSVAPLRLALSSGRHEAQAPRQRLCLWVNGEAERRGLEFSRIG
jgi:hypothetical protein